MARTAAQNYELVVLTEGLLTYTEAVSLSDEDYKEIHKIASQERSNQQTASHQNVPAFKSAGVRRTP